MTRAIAMSCLAVLLVLVSVPVAAESDGLVAFYPFCGGARDTSGNGNHGVVYGATLCPDRFGHASHAYAFDGDNDYIRVPHDPTLNFGTGDFTVCVWVLVDTDSDPGGTYFVTKGNAGYGATAWEVLQELDYTGRFYLSNGVGNFCNTGTGAETSLADGAWHFLTAVKRGTTLEFYTDGTPAEGSVTCTDVTTADTSYDLRFGVRGDLASYTYMSGKLDDIRIYNRALESEEIESLYQDGDPTATGSVAWGSIKSLFR